jgi:hypothetical protein
MKNTVVAMQTGIAIDRIGFRCEIQRGAYHQLTKKQTKITGSAKINNGVPVHRIVPHQAVTTNIAAAVKKNARMPERHIIEIN